MRTHTRLGSKGIAGLLLAGGIWAACGRAGVPQDAGAGWDAFRDRFVITEFETFPDFAVYEGRHEFDGKLPDWSAAGLSRTIAWLHATRDAAAAFPAASLDESRSVERDYIVAVMDKQLFWLERADAPHVNPDFYVSGNPNGPALSPDVYVTRPYAPVADRLRAYIAWARAVPGAVAQA